MALVVDDEAVIGAGGEHPPSVEHRADAVFLLPRIPRHAVVLGDPPGWRSDLEQRGISVSAEAGTSGPDLIVADDRHVAEALTSGADSVIVDGAPGARQELAGAGLATTRLLPLPVRGSPVMLIDLENHRAARYGVATGIVHPERWRTARNRAAALLTGWGLLPPARALITIGERRAGTAGARRGGGESVRPRLRRLGDVGVARQRHSPECAAAVLGRQLRSETRAQVRARARGRERRLRPRRAGRGPHGRSRRNRERARASLPRTLLRGRVRSFAGDGRRRNEAVVSAPPARLSTVEAPHPRADRAVDRRAGTEDGRPPSELEPERERLARDVLPFWVEAGIPPDLVEHLPPLPGVFCHNDLAEENIVVDGRKFTVLDWEWAQPAGLPLGDLIYFAVHTLRIVDGALAEEERDRHFVSVLTGEARSSGVLFRWVRQAVAGAGISPEAVATLVTLNWLDRGKLSTEERSRAEGVGGAPLAEAFAERATRLWLETPGLGTGWNAWREAR